MSDISRAEQALFAHTNGVIHEGCEECDRLWGEVVAAWQRMWKERSPAVTEEAA